MTRLHFVGYMWDGSTCVPRLEGLRAAGNEVSPFDAQHVFDAPSRIATSVAHRVYCTEGVRSMNRLLLESVADTHPDVVWIEKGDWVYPSTLRRLKAHAGHLVHYNTDDVYGRRTWFWLHRRGVPLYDCLLTTNRHNVHELRARYGARVLRAGMGYDVLRHVRPAGELDPVWDVVFIGHWEPHTEEYVSALMRAQHHVGVWGHGWRHARSSELRGVLPLPAEKYNTTIASAKLALCSLSKGNRNESTGRSFEIPALSVCLLAERTPEHEFLYGDGVGAVLFHGVDELLMKTQEMLHDEKRRRTITDEGNRLLYSRGLSWQDHMQREWPLVRNLLSGVPRSPDDDAPFWHGFRDGKAWEQVGTTSEPGSGAAL